MKVFVSVILVIFYSFFIWPQVSTNINCNKKRLWPVEPPNKKLLPKLNASIKKLISQNPDKRKISFLKIRKIAPLFLEYLQKKVHKINNVQQVSYIRGYVVKNIQNITDAGVICSIERNRFMWYIVLDNHIIIVGNQDKIVDSFATVAFIERVYKTACNGKNKKLQEYALIFRTNKPFHQDIILTNKTFYPGHMAELHINSSNNDFAIVVNAGGRVRLYYNKIDGEIYKSVFNLDVYRDYEAYDDKSYVNKGITLIAERDNGKKVLIYGGIKSEEYDSIYSIAISNNKKKIAFIAEKKHGIKVAVINNKESKEYENILHKLLFSPDSKKIAFRVNKVKSETVVVVNGRESREYITITGMKFSPDSKRFAFIAHKDNGKTVVVVDGVESKEYNAIMCKPVFSPNSRRVAFCAVKENGAYVAVIDGIESKEYGRIERMLFSSDSKRYAFIARNSKWMVVVDGEESAAYNVISNLIFSPDGKRYAFVAIENPEVSFAVIDGEQTKEYKNIWGLTFSSDGQKYAFLATKENNTRVVVLNGVESEEYMGLSDIRFSPDSEKIAFWAVKNAGRNIVVLNNKHSKEYLQINITNNIFFSKDSSKLIFYGKDDKGKYVLNIDNEEVGEYTYISFVGNLINVDKLRYFGCESSGECFFYTCSVK